MELKCQKKKYKVGNKGVKNIATRFYKLLLSEDRYQSVSQPIAA